MLSTDADLANGTKPDLLERFFKLKQHGTTVKTEAIAGCTTFITMCYVVFVVPEMLSATGMDRGALFVATCLVAGLSSIVMGLYANWPVGLAPGMGLNAFFAYAVVLGMGYSWEQAMGAVFWGGIGFMLLSIFKVREWIINSIPKGLRIGITAGIGLFLALIGLKNSGIVVADPGTIVGLGNITSFAPVMASLSLFLILALSYRNMKSAVLVSIAVITAIALGFGDVQYTGIVAAPPSIMPIFGKLDIMGALNPDMIGVIVAFMFVNLFDTTGTLIAVGDKAGLADENGKMENMSKAMVTDGTSSWIGAIMGAPTVTTYVESASGVAVGGRTGLTAVFVGLLFLLSLFLSPLAGMVPGYATAGALMYVAVLMTSSLGSMEWSDLTEAGPVVITTIMMPLSFSIANGIALGFIAYPVIKLLAGRVKEVSVSVWALAIMFALKFVIFGI
ncbi:NCS2 family permease [Endozoicomonas montiporae]|uniref:Xanthine/uracil/vitamin C permease n=1 Tax=Endozoicomonas montiporae CL-33 TaxID=570277 RepID=A0A142BG29_9GAMM|nr:NCS2 family permease [Endozoicomonas montiporae]AMO57705.1 xanthine/uracil/vitamin C permease [Endozoicomonas montiporae CL-33]